MANLSSISLLLLSAATGVAALTVKEPRTGVVFPEKHKGGLLQRLLGVRGQHLR